MSFTRFLLFEPSLNQVLTGILQAFALERGSRCVNLSRCRVPSPAIAFLIPAAPAPFFLPSYIGRSATHMGKR